MKTRNQIPELKNATWREQTQIWKRARKNSPRFRRIYAAWWIAIFFSGIASVPFYKAFLPNTPMGTSNILGYLTACIIGALGLFLVIYPELARALRVPDRIE